jgi:hypothetical protein
MNPRRPLSGRSLLGPLLASAAAALIAGCSGGMQQTPPTAGGANGPLAIPVQRSAASLPDGSGASVLYVANWYRNAVEVISPKKNHPLIKEISTAPYAPNSVHVDGSGNLWVALNTNGADPSVYVYKPGKSTPSRTLTGISNIAVGVAIDSDGTVYATDENEGFGNISVFAPGSNTPTSQLSDPNGSCCGWVAVDQHHNVFFTYESKSGHTGAIDEFVHGSTKPKSLGITLGTFPGGIEVLKDDTIIVTEQGITSFNLAAKIDTFKKGAKTPSSVITGDPTCDEWVGPALNAKKDRIYVGTLFTQISCYVNNNPAAIKEYTYPDGKLVSEITSGITQQQGWTLLVPALDPPAAGQ